MGHLSGMCFVYVNGYTLSVGAAILLSTVKVKSLFASIVKVLPIETIPLLWYIIWPTCAILLKPLDEQLLLYCLSYV